MGPTVLALASAVLLLPGPPAQAATAATADQQAQHAAAHLAHVQTQLDRALTAYDAALGGLGTQVSAGVQADDALAAAAQVTAAAQGQRTEEVRALYMDGGRLGLYASVLGASSPADLALRVVAVQRVVASSDQAVAAAVAAQSTAQQGQVDAEARTQQAVLFADDVTARARRVDRLVREGQAVYARLSAHARHVAAVQRAQARLAAAAAAAAQDSHSAAGQASADPIPATYLALYRSAAPTCPGLSWTLLAAVGQVESGHGRNNGPSSAGAVGPMQFMPRTFAAYAVDGDRDGRTSPWDPADAIFTAAHFLCAGGAGQGPAGVQRALLRYNNAQWYVDLVLAVQQRIVAAY